MNLLSPLRKVGRVPGVW